MLQRNCDRFAHLVRNPFCAPLERSVHPTDYTPFAPPGLAERWAVPTLLSYICQQYSEVSQTDIFRQAR